MNVRFVPIGDMRAIEMGTLPLWRSPDEQAQRDFVGDWTPGLAAGRLQGPRADQGQGVVPTGNNPDYHPLDMKRLVMLFAAGLLIAAFTMSLAALADSEKPGRRIALVIGNSDYVSVSHLTNPKNDATAVAQRLIDFGFSVTLLLDVGKADFEEQIWKFADSLNGAEAAVFFYAGHGLQIDGRNYLVPIDADISNEADLPFQLVAVDIALQRLASQRITSIVVLDACRNNPFSKKLSKQLGKRANAVGKGLASIYASKDTLISFSTQPGNVALDGDGPNSPFTEALVQHIEKPNADVMDVMRDVRRDVIKSTNERQVPWDTSSLVNEFYFHRLAPTVVASAGDKKRKASGDEVDIKRMMPPEETPVLTGKPPITLCDQIAASPTDPERVTEGSVFGDFDGPAGVSACRAALAKYPNTPRFEFQLARSLQKTKAFDEAASLYRSLVKRGYFAALVNYGWLLSNGEGVARDEKAGVRLYLLAAQQGDKFGMFNVAMAYDSGQGLPFDPSQAAAWIYAALRLGHDYSIKQMSGPAAGWTPAFRIALQRLLQRAGVYDGPLEGTFGPDVWTAVRRVQNLPFAPSPGGATPQHRWDPSSIPVNAPLQP